MDDIWMIYGWYMDDIWMIYGWYMDIWYINICRCRHHQTYVAANDSDRKSHSEPARRTPCTSCGKTRMMKRGQAIHWGQPGKKTIVYNIFVHYIIIYIYVCIHTLHYITFTFTLTFTLHTYIHTYIYIYTYLLQRVHCHIRKWSIPEGPTLWPLLWDLWRLMKKMTRPGKPTKKRGKITIFHGKTMENHHFEWENSRFQWPFSIANCNINLPEASNRRMNHGIFW